MGFIPVSIVDPTKVLINAPRPCGVIRHLEGFIATTPGVPSPLFIGQPRRWVFKVDGKSEDDMEEIRNISRGSGLAVKNDVRMDVLVRRRPMGLKAEIVASTYWSESEGVNAFRCPSWDERFTIKTHEAEVEDWVVS